MMLIFGVSSGLKDWKERREQPESTEELPESTQEPEPTTAPEASSEEATSEEETLPPSTEEPAESQPVISEAERLLRDLLAEDGRVPEEIPGEQLIVVAAKGTGSNMYFFEKDGDSWQFALRDIVEEKGSNHAVTGFVGREGVGSACEGHAITPAGLYALGPCFAKDALPGMKTEFFKITENHHWVGDDRSQWYNKLVIVTEDGTWTPDPLDTFEPAAVIRPEERDWEGEEHLIDYFPNYEFCVLMQYNYEPALPGMGSCFFLHVKYEPTGGCVAAGREVMEQVMYWLDGTKNPQICIYDALAETPESSEAVPGDETSEAAAEDSQPDVTESTADLPQ